MMYNSYLYCSTKITRTPYNINQNPVFWVLDCKFKSTVFGLFIDGMVNLLILKRIGGLIDSENNH